MKLLLVLLLAGCSSFFENKAATSTLKILQQSNVAARRLADVQLAREAAPGGVVQLAAFATAHYQAGSVFNVEENWQKIH